MTYRRKETNYFTTAANANAQSFNFVFNDGYRTLHIESVYIGNTTSGVSVQLQVNGKFKAKLDATRFANGNEPVHVEFDVPNNQTLVVVLQNLAGAALTNLPVVIGYTVDQDV